MLYDMHCHLDFADDGGLAARSVSADIAAFSATVAPDSFVDAREGLADCPNVRMGLGLHPWQAARPDFPEQVATFEREASKCAFVGEVGLDFSAKHAAFRDRQLEAFDRVVRACMQPCCSREAVFGCGMVSIHAVRAIDEVIDAFERAGALSNANPMRTACVSGRALVLHSFNGTSDQLQRSIRSGFFFSVGPRMLASKKGRAYARAIPADRLLIETDMPTCAHGAFSVDAWRYTLEETLASLADACRQDREALREALAVTSRRILGM